MQKYIKHAFKISTIIITSPLVLLGIVAYTVIGYVVTGFNMGKDIWEMLTDWTNND